MPKGSRGAKAGGGRRKATSSGIKEQLQSIQKSGGFPTAIPHGGNQMFLASVLRDIDDVFDYSPAQKQYISGKMKSGRANVTVKENTPGQLYIQTSYGVTATSYPIGQTAAETGKTRAGALKLALINHLRENGVR